MSIIRNFSSEPIGIPEVPPQYKGFWTFILEGNRSSQHGIEFRNCLDELANLETQATEKTHSNNNNNNRNLLELPAPPSNCCMSACKHCVWTDYMIKIWGFSKGSEWHN